jgi:hypothetical protein
MIFFGLMVNRNSPWVRNLQKLSRAALRAAFGEP